MAEYASEHSIQHSPPPEHWSVRLNKVPLPPGVKSEEELEREWKPWMMCDNPNPTEIIYVRRSSRLMDKQPCVFYPPYGQCSGPDAPQKNKQTSTQDSCGRSVYNVPPPRDSNIEQPYFTPEEKKEMLQSVFNNPKPAYRMSKGWNADSVFDPFVATSPVLTKFTEESLAAVGWTVPKEE